jgi:hypothetical protein
MDWKRAIEEERAALMRLVALLHALARLAEIVAGRSPAVRGFVLWLLRRAAAAARDFVSGDADLPAAATPPHTATEPAGVRPEDAIDLAETFRALAWQLEVEVGLLLALGGVLPDRDEHEPCGGCRAFAEAGRRAFSERVGLVRFDSASHVAPDTS